MFLSSFSSSLKIYKRKLNLNSSLNSFQKSFFSLNSLSYDSGISSSKLIGNTIGKYFDIQVKNHSNTLALISKHQNIRWTYEQLSARINIIANKLITLGIRPGDRVGIWSPNNSEWTLTQLATAKMGAILVNINPSYQQDELQYALNLVGCKALILASSLKSTNYIQIIQNICPELSFSQPGQLNSKNIPSLKYLIRIDDVSTPGMLNFHDLLPFSSSTNISLKDSQESNQLQLISSSLHFDDPINIQFTSGTTGRPKGATLTHHNILNNGFYVGEGINLKPNEKVCIPVPLYHCFGMVMGNIACITHGATMVYPSSLYDPIETLNTISTEQCNVIYGVPTMFISQLEHPEFHLFNLSSLRSGITAGSLCPSNVMKQLINKMNLREITNCYGMTELSPVCTQTKVDDTFEKKITSVGCVHPHLELQIVNPNYSDQENLLKFNSLDNIGNNQNNNQNNNSDNNSDNNNNNNGLVVPRGKTGELWVRGYSVMKGYWNDEKKTKESITEDGWMKTGDLASMTEDGYIVIEGRLKDMIIRGGENIYPKEVEEFLYTHPMIQDVQIVGLPDKKYGEELCAWIILKENKQQQEHTTHHHITEDDIRNYCKGKIAHYKIPRYIRFVKSFPLTISGKVRKIEIRETMIAELGLNEKKDSLA